MAGKPGDNKFYLGKWQEQWAENRDSLGEPATTSDAPSQEGLKSGSTHAAGVLNTGDQSPEGLRLAEQEQSRKWANFLVILEDINQDLEVLFSRLRAVQEEKARIAIEIALKERELARQEAELAEQEARQAKVEEELEEEEQNIARLEAERIELEETKEKSKKELKTANLTATEHEILTQKISSCDLDLAINSASLEQARANRDRLIAEREAIIARIPGLKDRAEQIKNDITALKAEWQKLDLEENEIKERLKTEIRQRIDDLEAEQLEQHKDDPAMQEKIKETFKELRFNIEVQEKWQAGTEAAFSSKMIEAAGNPALLGELVSISSEISTNPKFTAKVENVTAMLSQQERLTALQAVIAQNADIPRSQFLEENIKDFEKINAQYLLEDGSPVHNAIVRAAAWKEGIDLSLSDGHHEGHATVTYNGMDVYTGTDPENDQGPFYTLNPDGSKNWIKMPDEKTMTQEEAAEATNAMLSILEQAYTGTPPKPFYNETSKAGEGLLEKRANRDVFYAGTADLSTLQKNLAALTLHAMEDIKPSDDDALLTGISGQIDYKDYCPIPSSFNIPDSNAPSAERYVSHTTNPLGMKV